MKAISHFFKSSQYLHTLSLDLGANHIGSNEENYKYLGLLLHSLPTGLNNLSLYLPDNWIGDKVENLKYLGKGFENMISLKNLSLDLSNNSLGERGNLQSLLIIGEGF